VYATSSTAHRLQVRVFLRRLIQHRKDVPPANAPLRSELHRGEFFPLAHPPHRGFGKLKKFSYLGDGHNLPKRIWRFGGVPCGGESFIVAEAYQGSPLLKRWFRPRDLPLFSNNLCDAVENQAMNRDSVAPVSFLKDDPS